MNSGGYRGYITAGRILGEHTPQHVQNLVLRDYARQHGLHYKLSATEYAMPGCYMMLEQVLNELPQLDGVLCYSLFMLPQRRDRRAAVWRRVLDGGWRLAAALEGQMVACAADVARVEDILAVRRALSHCPVRL
jgi:sporadic carbohydrate cluster protein (TIGR04323 family)